MDLIIDDNTVVKIDYIFLLRQLLEAEETGNTKLQAEIKQLLFDFLEQAEEHQRLPYGPSIKISNLKKLFPLNMCLYHIVF